MVDAAISNASQAATSREAAACLSAFIAATDHTALKDVDWLVNAVE